MKNVFAILMLLSVLFVSCDDENGLTGGGRMQVALTVTPPPQNIPFLGSTYQEYVQIYTPFSVTVSPASPGGYVISEEYSVTKGQNFSISIVSSTYAPCRNVKVEFILNGNVVRTDNYSMGYSSAIGVSPLTTCPDGTSKTLNYIVP